MALEAERALADERALVDERALADEGAVGTDESGEGGLTLSLDLGSTNFKAALFDAHLSRLAEASVALPYAVLDLPRAEFDEAAAWQAAVHAVHLVAEHASIALQDVRTLALTSQAQTFALFDAIGAPLTPFVSWMDARAANEASQLDAAFGPAFHAHCSFAPPLAELQLAKILWLRTHDPAALERAARIMPLPTWVAARMAGVEILDRNLAAMSGLYSLEAGGWWWDYDIESGRPISMCGQMCGNPLYTMLLLGIGLRTLSVTPSAIPEVKRVCRSVSIEQCERVAEQVYQGDLVAFPGPWGFLGKANIILVSDQELETIAADPDAEMNLALTFAPRNESLRQICERAQKAGFRTLIVAFDHFFRQYRPGQDTPRRLTPDMPEYVALIARISQFAQQYGLGLELSLLSPLEIGPAYEKATGESGRWLHYRKGLRDPQTGTFSVQLWRQRRWANNKGPIDVQDAGVRVFAFQEHIVRGTPYRVVPPESIVEITDVAQVDVWEGSTVSTGQRIRVHGTGRADIGPLNRVLVVQAYRTPEMDYFSPQALPYLQKLVDQYAEAGVKLNALYSDEMHIQQDWGYFQHHEHGEFAQRYVSDGLARAFAERYGEEYRDLAKYLIYFTRGQEDFAHDLSAKEGIMHVFGASPEAVRQTALLRARYYQLLQDGVVDLFVAAKRHAEQRMGHRLESRAHATWAESPTIDRWNTGQEPMARSQYEYTSNFSWSCTVHQAAAAGGDAVKKGPARPADAYVAELTRPPAEQRLY